MRAVIVGASDFNAAHFAQQDISSETLVVAVDGGYAHLKAAGIASDVVVGDFDSLGYVPLTGKVCRFPVEKDESDTQLACRLACERGATTLVLYGCLGRRLDHTLANLQVMLAVARGGRRVFAIGDDYAIAVLYGTSGHPGVLRFGAIPLETLSTGSYGSFVSMFAVGGIASGVSEQGLKYTLDAAVVRDDVSLGLSNEFMGTQASIAVGEGALVVTFPLAAWDYLEEEGI